MYTSFLICLCKSSFIDVVTIAIVHQTLHHFTEDMHTCQFWIKLNNAIQISQSATVDKAQASATQLNVFLCSSKVHAWVSITPQDNALFHYMR